MRQRRSAAQTLVGMVLGGLLLVGILAGCRTTSPWAGLDAEGIFEKGLAAFQEEDWGDAVEAFEIFTSRYPGHGRIAEGRMYLARSYFRRGEFISSAAEFERFLQLHPSHGLAPEASLGICRSYVELSPHPQRDQQYTERARDACRQTRNEFQGMNVADEAEALRVQMVDRLAERTFMEARFYQRRNAFDSAILIFQDLVDFYPETEWAPRGFLGLYESYRSIGWDEEAEQVRDRLLFLYPESEAAREVRQRQAEQDDGV